LKVLKGKQQDMLAQGIASLEHPDAKPLFPIVLGDHNLKRQKMTSIQ
jgi:hypothetical protein